MTDLGHKALAGVASGWVAAAATDYHTFLSWKKWDDAVTYDWGQATFRWAQGMLTGLLTALGMTAFTG